MDSKMYLVNEFRNQYSIWELRMEISE